MTARRMLMAALAGVAIAACGAARVSSTGGAPTPAGSRAPATPGGCGVPTPVAGAPIGATQALAMVQVDISTAVSRSPGTLKLGLVSCVKAAVGQVVSIEVEARVPPVPREPATMHLLSSVSIASAVPAGAATPSPLLFTVTFTAASPGHTWLTYLPATCTLPLGAC